MNRLGHRVRLVDMRLPQACGIDRIGGERGGCAIALSYRRRQSREYQGSGLAAGDLCQTWLSCTLNMGLMGMIMIACSVVGGNLGNVVE